MKKYVGTLLLFLFFAAITNAQKISPKNVPSPVSSSLKKKYPDASKVTWEKEKGNYEANWGGREGEDHSVQFSADGTFIEQVNAIPVSGLPASVHTYVQQHYKGAKITEAGKVTDAQGKTFYEAELQHKDLLFDEKGNFIKKED